MVRIFFLMAVLTSVCPGCRQPNPQTNVKNLEAKYKSQVVADFFREIQSKLTDDEDCRLFRNMVWYFIRSDRKALGSLYAVGLKVSSSSYEEKSNPGGLFVSKIDTESIAEKSENTSDRMLENPVNEDKLEIISQFLDGYINYSNNFHDTRGSFYLEKSRGAFIDFMLSLFFGLRPKIEIAPAEACSAGTNNASSEDAARNVGAAVVDGGEAGGHRFRQDFDLPANASPVILLHPFEQQSEISALDGTEVDHDNVGEANDQNLRIQSLDQFFSTSQDSDQGNRLVYVYHNNSLFIVQKLPCKRLGRARAAPEQLVANDSSENI